MDKKLIIIATGGCAALAAAVAAKNREHGPKATIWDKMREGMEEMPEDFPARVMFDNIEATRANTEHILDLLHAQRWAEDTDASIEDIAVVRAT